jgi:hypothetical protein
MEPADLSEDLERIGLTADGFAKLTGTKRERVLVWLKGKDDVPPWVPVLTALLALPGALEKAQEVAAFYLEEEDSE